MNPMETTICVSKTTLFVLQRILSQLFLRSFCADSFALFSMLENGMGLFQIFFFWFLALLSSIFLVALVVSIKRVFFPKDVRYEKPVTALTVLGSGGHTTEMIRLIQGLHCSSFQVIHVLVAEQDTLSAIQADVLKDKGFPIQVHRITRSRSVGQSFVSAVPSTLLSFIDSVLIVFRSNPSLVLVNGPGTCLPVCLAAKLISCSTVVFIESICRVSSLSLTGTILYYFVDHFLIQWPTLLSKYPKAKYRGILV